MKKFLLSTAALLLIGSATMAAEITIATGKAGGGYDAASQTLGMRLSQRGHDVSVVNLNGSDEISLALCSGQANVGYMQIDAMYARALDGCSLTPAGIYGVEHAVLLVPNKSKIDELSDFSASTRVLVDTIGSGTELFWRTIVKIETGDQGSNSGWAKAKAVNEPLSSANTLADFRDIDAVLMVRTLDSKDIAKLIDLGWKMVELWDKDINDLKYNGKPLYESSEVKGRTSNGQKFKGYVYAVRSYVVTTTDRAVVDVVRGAF